MGSVFRFKQFEVDQADCAMKINTDGVLLAAYVKQVDAQRILDIGTGTGVIALMLAQQYPEALVHGVEIDPLAARRAAQNFAATVFPNEMQLFEGSFEDLATTLDYDLIVSNPPFYTNSLHAPDERKKLAKHTDEDFFEKLLAFVAQRLHRDGTFHCIVPAELADWLVAQVMPKHALQLQAVLAISSFADGPVIRKLLKIGREPQQVQLDQLAIYVDRGVYSMAYKELLKPYFLAF